MRSMWLGFQAAEYWLFAAPWAFAAFMAALSSRRVRLRLGTLLLPQNLETFPAAPNPLQTLISLSSTPPKPPYIVEGPRVSPALGTSPLPFCIGHVSFCTGRPGPALSQSVSAPSVSSVRGPVHPKLASDVPVCSTMFHLFRAVQPPCCLGPAHSLVVLHWLIGHFSGRCPRMPQNAPLVFARHAPRPSRRDTSRDILRDIARDTLLTPKPALPQPLPLRPAVWPARHPRDMSRRPPPRCDFPAPRKGAHHPLQTCALAHPDQ